ncbi:MAG: DNA repair protein RecN [Candidatus Latescibacteria bacterium]|nr:DNA repair protein RecN [Candidatus Latescibacterota bacterium]NIM21514.1 DNA repair protein RecN [Candidatus Latescibacterota bacterium]NIM65685.1 DNA repair protein RecN [Candidatus Latescibacterota bacterium]NIO02067.1 DNA repair protein RecN [Candidatus Latescibacterota bacterium]NIO28879.1 DNA repair protein RecN [Candidatus Latescibacterota bacterium]
MLVELRIKNLAVVEDVTLTFRSGLNVLTGSTGAGKSLILSAVNLLLGERASARVIRKGAETAVVEGVFRFPRAQAKDLFPAIIKNDRITLRREVQRNGRSFAHVQGKPTALKELHEVCVALIEPHGQNEQLRLKDPDNHVAYVDAVAGNEKLRAGYAEALDRVRASAAALRDFDKRISLLKEKHELLEHRIEEIDRARIVKGEKETLEASLRIMENVQSILDALNTASETLYEGDSSAVSGVSQAIRQISRIRSVDPKFEVISEALETAEITLKECAREIRSYLGNIEHDPAALQEMQERHAFLAGLERRYGKSIDQVLEDRDSWERELEALSFEDEERRELNQDLDQKVRSLEAIARKLSDSRAKAARTLDAKVTREMERLMMPGATFRTKISHEVDPDSPLAMSGRPLKLHPHGVDRVEFVVRTNKGEAEGGVSEIASSGEVSRIALALKKITHAGAQTGTLVFDEIDAGVGADLGDVIARELHSLSERYQIVCITHMPQIAASGNTHIVVSKISRAGRTHVQASPVDGKLRLREISRMLGGREGSEKRLALAAEMLEKRRKSPSDSVRP